MPRYACSGRSTCEGCKSLDVRDLQRRGLLQPGLSQSWNWSRNGEPTGSVSFKTEHDAILLIYRFRLRGALEWKDVRQRVYITWTSCTLGGRRPWFRCRCGRRVAILYGYDQLFECRHCYRLAYVSQSQTPRDRSLSRAQKIRMRLGGSPSIFDPFPEKPLGMHWSSYDRLRAKSLTAEMRSMALMEAYLDTLDRRWIRRV